jgi:hypothetical protein
MKRKRVGILAVIALSALGIVALMLLLFGNPASDTNEKSSTPDNSDRIESLPYINE